jgi:Glycosyl transferase family 2
MIEEPFFSIVMPTYGRGRHIRPSIESVLGQSFRDFELIVVGDGCTDDTEAVVRSFPQAITWRNLPRNSGSQSFPNNEGIRTAHGRWIAYIGHDDIWAPHHLAQLARIAATELADFVVSGCVFHGPKGSDDYYVTGLFAEPDAALRHFCPPTSIAHRRDVTARIGGWRDPLKVKAPADNEFLLRAARAGLRFASTGEVTVHKFAAGNRYLSYLRVGSGEQRELLQSLRQPAGFDVDAIVRKSKANGQYMVFEYGDYSGHPDGYLFEQNRKRKGITRPALRPLLDRTVIGQTDEPRGSDWHELETDANGRRYRWSGPNPQPKILIPYTGRRARLVIEVVAKNPRLNIEEVALHAEERPVACWTEAGSASGFRLLADIPLSRADYTVLTLNAPTFRPVDLGRGDDRRKLGIGVGDTVLEPLKPRLQRLFWPLARRRPND